MLSIVVTTSGQQVPSLSGAGFSLRSSTENQRSKFETQPYRIMNSGLPSTRAARSCIGAASIAAPVDSDSVSPIDRISLVASGGVIRCGRSGLY